VPGLRVDGAPTLGVLLAWLRGGQRGAGAPPGPAPGGSGSGMVAAADLATAPAPGRPATDAPDGRSGGRPSPPPDLADALRPPGPAWAGGPAGRGGRGAAGIGGGGAPPLPLRGPRGGGKTMLAERLPTIMPPRDSAAALEVTSIPSVAGALPDGGPLITQPP